MPEQPSMTDRDRLAALLEEVVDPETDTPRLVDCDLCAGETSATGVSVSIDAERLARAIARHREGSNAGEQGCDHHCAESIASWYDR